MQKQKFLIIICVLAIAASGIFIASRVFGVTVAGTLDMSGNKIINLGGNTTEVKYEAANKDYVDSAIGKNAQANYLPKWDLSVPVGFVKSLISDNGSVIDFHQKEGENFVIDNRTTDPSPLVTGQIWICTDTDSDCDGD